MTKAEFTNDLVYDMTGYLDIEGGGEIENSACGS